MRAGPLGAPPTRHMEIADDQALKVGDAELLRCRTVDDSNPYVVGRERHKRNMAVQQR